MELKGQTALVTGGTAGIGAAAARLLVREGADVFVTGRDEGRGAETVAAIEAEGFEGTVRFVQADISEIPSLAQLVEAVGDVDILVNNAASFPPNLTLGQDIDSYDKMFDTNVRAPYFLTAALAPAMLAKGSGSIVNVTSMAASIFVAYSSAYSAGKAALASMSRTWAAEFGSRGVRVNCVAPGPTHTENVLFEWGEEVVRNMAKPLPLGRTARPTEIAEAILFLASPRASFITGAVLAADGGGVAAISGGGSAITLPSLDTLAGPFVRQPV